MNLNDGLIGLQKEPPYQPPFKVGDDVYILTCGMKEPATIAEAPYKTMFTRRFLAKVFLAKARTHVVYDIANIVHREREMDKLSSWEVMYNVLGFDIRDVPPDKNCKQVN